MVIVRTINEAFAKIQADDPNTSLTLTGFRKLVVSGAIPSIKRGNKYLVDMAVVESYFKGEILPRKTEPAGYGTIRRLEVV